MPGLTSRGTWRIARDDISLISLPLDTCDWHFIKIHYIEAPLLAYTKCAADYHSCMLRRMLFVKVAVFHLKQEVCFVLMIAYIYIYIYFHTTYISFQFTFSLTLFLQYSNNCFFITTYVNSSNLCSVRCAIPLASLQLVNCVGIIVVSTTYVVCFLIEEAL